jgi:hypothetical protein
MMVRFRLVQPGGWTGGYQYEVLKDEPRFYAYCLRSTGLTAGVYTINVRDSKAC